MDELKIQELVEWELSIMNHEALEDFFYIEKVQYYINNPESFNNKQLYMKQYTNPINNYPKVPMPSTYESRYSNYFSY